MTDLPGGVTPAENTSSKPSRRRLRRWLFLYLPALYATWLGVLYLNQDAMLFPRHVVRPMPPESLPWATRAADGMQHEAAPVRLVRKLDDGGEVEAWLLPAPQNRPDRPSPLVVYLHGNAELIDHQRQPIGKYHDMGCSVLLPEYRGYGRSAGKPSQAGIVDDAVYILDLALQRPDIDRSRIIIHGKSLGGGVAAQLAALRKPAGLILECTFTSVAVMARGYGAPQWLARHPFRTDRVLPDLDVPVLILHGCRDRVVPVAHGHRLRDLARRGTYIEYDRGHENLSAYDDFWGDVRAFLIRERLLPALPPGDKGPQEADE